LLSGKLEQREKF